VIGDGDQAASDGDSDREDEVFLVGGEAQALEKARRAKLNSIPFCRPLYLLHLTLIKTYSTAIATNQPMGDSRRALRRCGSAR
jgi:hypothetical protein